MMIPTYPESHPLPLTKPRYSLLAAIPASFYSADFYRDVKENWQGIGFLYLFVIQLTLVTILTGVAVYAFNKLVYHDEPPLILLLQEGAYELAGQIPDMVIANNELQVVDDTGEPYALSLTIDGETFPFVVIDPEGHIEDLDANFPPVLVTKHGIHIRDDNKGKIESMMFKEMEIPDQPLALNNEVVYDLIDKTIAFLNENKTIIYLSMGIFIWACIMLLAFIYRVIQVLILGALMMLLRLPFHVAMIYQDAVRLTIVALTPPILIDAVLMGFGHGLPSWAFIGITAAYMLFALNANKPLRAAA